MVLVHSIFLPLARVLLATRAAREHRARVKIVCTLRLLGVRPCKLLIAHL